MGKLFTASIVHTRNLSPRKFSRCLFGILALFYVAQNNYHQFYVYFQDKKLINSIAMGFLTYFISVTIDQRYWKFIPGEELAHVPLEETLEVVGHLFIGYGFAFASNKIQYLKRT